MTASQAFLHRRAPHTRTRQPSLRVPEGKVHGQTWMCRPRAPVKIASVLEPRSRTRPPLQRGPRMDTDHSCPFRSTVAARHPAQPVEFHQAGTQSVGVFEGIDGARRAPRVACGSDDISLPHGLEAVSGGPVVGVELHTHSTQLCPRHATQRLTGSERRCSARGGHPTRRRPDAYRAEPAPHAHPTPRSAADAAADRGGTWNADARAGHRAAGGQP